MRKAASRAALAILALRRDQKLVFTEAEAR